jgi:hypothetical protein
MIEFGAILEDTENQLSYEEIPKFQRYLKPPREEGYRGELYALNMHGEAGSGIISEINRIDMLQKDMRSGKWQQRIDDENKKAAEQERVQGLPDLIKRAGLHRGQQDLNDVEKLIAPRKLLREFSEFLIENGFENISKERGNPKVNLGKVTVAGKNFFAFDWNFISPLFGDRICRRSIDPSCWYWDSEEDEFIPSTGVCLERAGIMPTDSHTSLGDAWDVIRLTRRAIDKGATCC